MTHGLWRCSALQIDRVPLKPRAIGLAARFQCVGEQFDAVLSPKYLAVEHIDRRAKHVGCECVLAVLLIGRADRLRARALDQLLAGKPRRVGAFGHLVRVGQIELTFPDRQTGPPQKRYPASIAAMTMPSASRALKREY